MSTVPVFAPDGTLGDIPAERLPDAVKAGFKPGVHMTAPDGTKGIIPADRYVEAAKAGMKVEPFEEQPIKQPGFWHALASDLGGMVQSGAKVAGALAQGPAGLLPLAQETGQTITENMEARKKDNRSLAYRTIAPVGDAIGVNTRGMEDAANAGDVGGVAGHAAAVPAAMALTEGAMRGLPKAAEAVRTGTAPARQSVAESMITKLIKPSRNDVAFGKNPAGAIVKEGITANSLDELGDKVYAKAREVGAQIDQTLQTPDAQAKTVDVSKSLTPIDEELKRAVQTGDKVLYSKLKDLKQQLTQIWAEDTQGGISPTGPKKMEMTPYEATQFKRQVGDMTRWTGTDPFEQDLNAVKGRIFGSVKDQVNAAVPEVAALNERYANLASAGKAIERRSPVAARNSEWSLTDLGTGVAAAHYGGPAAAGFVVAKKILSSTRFKTRAAQILSGPPTQ